MISFSRGTRWALVPLVLLLSGVARSEVPATPSVASPGAVPVSSGDPLAVQLKNTVVEAQKKLGDLPPWQKRIFDEEVVPQYQRFIRDYRQTGSGVSVELEMEVLKHYLRFYWPNFEKVSGKQLLIATQSPADCSKCLASTPVLRGLLKARLERRGFTPVWLGPEESARVESLAELAKTRNAAGYVFLQWAPVASDDIDSAHVEDRKYFIHLLFLIRDFDKQEGRLEILENDAFETSLARLLTDANTGFGIRAEAILAEKDQANKMETLIELSGFKTFRQYEKARELLEFHLKSTTPILERKITQGRITLAVVGAQNLDEIQRVINLVVRDPALGGSVKLEVQ